MAPIANDRTIVSDDETLARDDTANIFSGPL